MMNPIGAFFALAARSADIRRVFALFEKNKAENSEMIDIVRSLAGDIGVLTQAPQAQAPAAVPSALRKYDTRWIQATLNKLINTQLRVDGDLGGPDSATRNAVRTFQTAHPPMLVDGNPGVQTVSVMALELGKLEAR